MNLSAGDPDPLGAGAVEADQTHNCRGPFGTGESRSILSIFLFCPFFFVWCLATIRTKWLLEFSSFQYLSWSKDDSWSKLMSPGVRKNSGVS